MVQITILFLMFFRDVQCALHNDREITEKVMFAHFKGTGEIQQFVQYESDIDLNCV